jgi:hypothetical protein
MICKDLKSTLHVCHNTLLSISYRIPKPLDEILSALTSARGDSSQHGQQKRCVVPVTVVSIKQEETPNTYNKQQQPTKSNKQKNMKKTKKNKNNNNNKNKNKKNNKKKKNELTTQQQQQPTPVKTTKPKRGRIKDSHNDDDQEFEVAQETMSVEATSTQQLMSTMKSGLQSCIDENKSFNTRQHQFKVLNKVHELVSADTFVTLQKWVSRIAATRRDSLFVLVSLFPLIGVPVVVAKKLYFVLNELRGGSLNLKMLPIHLLKIKTMSVLCYDVLQITVDLIKLFTRVVLFRRLPAHYTNGQLSASQRVFQQQHLSMSTSISGESVYDAFDFLWCSVCNSLYSMTREYKAGHLKTYKFGYRNAVATYTNDHLFCWRNKVNVIGACKTVPLVRISLFGVVLKHDNKCITLCGTCCAPMAIDVNRCMFNDNGAMCVKCAEADSNADDAQAIHFLYHIQEQQRTCVICAKELKTPSSSIFYHEGVFLCNLHHHVSLVRKINELQLNNWQTHKQKLTAEQVRVFLIQSHQLFKAKQIEQKKPGWKREQIASKLSRNTKR